MGLIRPFKKRKINWDKPVEVYRNIRGRDYSIRQAGVVVGHATHLAMGDCTFVVQPAGNRLVRKTKRKNVHAFIRGILSNRGIMGTLPEYEKPLPAKVTYDPYRNTTFMMSLGSILKPVKTAYGVIINKHGVTASYTA